MLKCAMMPQMMPLLLYTESRDIRETVLSKYNEALVTCKYTVNAYEIQRTEI
jgi:hypothetical protein